MQRAAAALALILATAPLVTLRAQSAGTPEYRVETLRNNISGSVTYQLQGNEVPGGPSRVELNAQYFPGDRATTPVPRYSVVIIYWHTEPINIPRGQSLTLLAGGRSMELSGNGSVGFRNRYGPNTREMAVYDLTLDQLRELAAAPSVRLVLTGEAGQEERELSATNLENLRRFLADHLEADGAGAD